MDPIQRLHMYLVSLPETLPKPSIPSVDLRAFSYDTEWVEQEGIEWAINRELEVRLGARTNSKDTFTITERGPGIEALAQVLEGCLKQFPDSVLLQKWVSDSIIAAEMVYTAAGSALPSLATVSLAVSSSTNKAGGAKRKQGHAQPQVKRPDTKILSGFGDVRYKDLPEPPKRSSGAQQNPLIPKVSRLCLKLVTKEVDGNGNKNVGDGGDGRGRGSANKHGRDEDLDGTDNEDGEGGEHGEHGEGGEDGENGDGGENGEDGEGGEDGKDAEDSEMPSPEALDGKHKCKANTKAWRCCIASSRCGMSWSNSNLQRILKHAASCEYIPRDLRCEVREALAKKAAGNTVLRGGKSNLDNDSDSDGEQCYAKRAKTEPKPSTTARKDIKASDKMQVFINEGKKQVKVKADYHLMLYLVCSGIAICTVKS
ncbi:hypothetical protein EWM64_g4726 [Hericium alpestre]|uniref:Uncharacterized protein n=1 Tax=Hericium alpestre TaxID=135208 RepID=A0A4Z0A0S0_9AGAM|nr:hypothetical protein EWM64_g4726 [Hericium alpestre]